MCDGLVSIIMPAYNVAGYIAESIKSIQNQIYVNWELLVINDGSTDNTAEVVSKLAQDDKRIHLHTQKNAGVSTARNKGLSLAQGQYVAFLDGDDLWEKEFLSVIISAKEKVKADMGYCGYDHFYSKGYRRRYRYAYPSGWILPDAVRGTVRLHICALVVDKALLDTHHIAFTEGCAIGEDWEFIAKIITHAKVQSVSQNYMLYRVRPGSAITAKWKWEKHIDAIISHVRIKEYVLKHTENTRELVDLLDESLAYKIYRFLWRMIKNDYQSEAKELMMKDEYREPFLNLRLEKLRLIDQIKYSIVRSGNPLLWKISKMF